MKEKMIRNKLNNHVPPELLPVISAYMGCTCSYDFYVSINEEDNITEVLRPKSLIRLADVYQFHNLKLHLRCLHDIAEKELYALVRLATPAGESFYWGEEYQRHVLEKNKYFTAEQINYLRSIGICTDLALVATGLVKFVES